LARYFSDIFEKYIFSEYFLKNQVKNFKKNKKILKINLILKFNNCKLNKFISKNKIGIFLRKKNVLRTKKYFMHNEG
jgi:hypothetical protein